MNKRKFFGTILGLIFWSFCVVFFTYAYYDWKSDSTNVVLGIEDLSVECLVGAEVNANNIGPVLNYQDGVISEFSIKNGMDKEMVIDLRLDITNISDNLLVESLKYVVVTDTTGGTNYDYESPILEGDFENFIVGSNLITTALAITPSITQKFQFIVYIDGNMYNNPSMQENSLEANLMIGNCDENAVSMDEMAYQAIYSETDNSLTFIYNKSLEVGDTYNDKEVTAVYTGFETETYILQSNVPWYKDGNYQKITSVSFEAVTRPKSITNWFRSFTNLISIDLQNLDTSDISDMGSIFRDCSSLTKLDLSDFNTSKVTSMRRMFSGCSSLLELNLTGFNTNKVNDMGYMFYDCKGLISLDLGNFNTGNVTNMDSFFYDCSSLTSLDVSSFDTSNVTNMGYMFYGCKGLTSLNLSNFNTIRVTNMESIFQYCSNLVELDLSDFNTSNVTNMAGIFSQCSKLKNVRLTNFDTSKVRNINHMFGWCVNLNFEITIKNADITDYIEMFIYAATSEGTQITVNYTADTSTLVDSMIATKSDNSNVVKGVCVDCGEES